MWEICGVGEKDDTGVSQVCRVTVTKGGKEGFLPGLLELGEADKWSTKPMTNRQKLRRMA